MIRLSVSTVSLDAVLGQASTVRASHAIVSFYDEAQTGKPSKGGTQTTVVSTATAIAICDAPQQNYVRNIDTLSFFNNDTVTTRVSIRLNESTTTHILVQKVLAVSTSLFYENNTGWVVL